MTEIDDRNRRRVLQIAGQFAADRSAPHSVLLAAAPLLAWLEQAPDRTAAGRRLFALETQDHNCSMASVRAGSPESLIEGAAVLCGFLDAGGEAS